MSTETRWPSDDLLILVDHANIRLDRQRIRSLIDFWASLAPPRPVSHALVRLYGGWFDDVRATDARHEALEAYSTSSPAVHRLASTVCRTTLQFADGLAASDLAPTITHTVARRRMAPRFSRALPAPECQHVKCGLKETRRWTKRATACTNRDCLHQFGDMHLLREQKQVDTHLAVDIIAYHAHMRDTQTLAVCSGDWDMIPPLLVAASAVDGRAQIVWVRTSGDVTYADEFLATCPRFHLLEL